MEFFPRTGEVVVFGLEATPVRLALDACHQLADLIIASDLATADRADAVADPKLFRASKLHPWGPCKFWHDGASTGVISGFQWSSRC
jgi:hypothetical protein